MAGTVRASVVAVVSSRSRGRRRRCCPQTWLPPSADALRSTRRRQRSLGRSGCEANTEPSRRVPWSSRSSIRQMRAKLCRRLGSHSPVPTAIWASRSDDLVVSGIPTSFEPRRPITMTGRSLPCSGSSSNGTHAHTTSPGSGSPSIWGEYSTVTTPSLGSWRSLPGAELAGLAGLRRAVLLAFSVVLVAALRPRAMTSLRMPPMPPPERADGAGADGFGVGWSGSAALSVAAESGALRSTPSSRRLPPGAFLVNFSK